MDWIGMLGGGIAGYFGGAATNATADTNSMLSRLNADTTNRLTTASNGAAAAQSSLARWTQSVNNNRALKAGGLALEANTVNAERRNDMGVAQDFSTSIKNAEQAGMAAASQGAAGVGGQVQDMVNASVALRQGIVNQQVAQARTFGNYDVARRAGSIMSQTVGGLDSSIILDKLNYNQAFAQTNATVSGFARLVRGAFPYAHDAIGNSTQKAGSSQTSYTQEAIGLSMRQRSSSPYDLADAASDQGIKLGDSKFSFDTGTDAGDSSPYSLGSSNMNLGNNAPSDSGSIYSLY